MKKLILTEIVRKDRRLLVFSLFDEKQSLEDFRVFPAENSGPVGDICSGRVEQINEKLGCAFVRIAEEQRVFLPLQEKQTLLYSRKQSKAPELHVGDEIIVQIEKAAVKTKLPVATTSLTLQGNYCVLTTADRAVGVSRKLSSEVSGELRRFAEELLPTERNYGLILRTNAGGVSRDLLQEDIADLTLRYSRLLERSAHCSAGTRLEGNPSDVLTALKGLPLEELAIETDLTAVYEEISAVFPFLKTEGRLLLYRDPSYSLSARFGLLHQLEELTTRQVWLKSGANIIIEQLETLNFIDVNTAKSSGKIRKDGSHILAVNIEAAREIARQIRFRNLSGMILIDFINMKSKEEEEELIEYLKIQLQKDPVRCSFIDLTGLGLAELTRQKVNASLKETIGA